MSFPYAAFAVIAVILSFFLGVMCLSMKIFLSLRKHKLIEHQDIHSNIEVDKNIKSEKKNIEVDEDDDDMISIKIPLKYYNVEQNDEEIIIRSKDNWYKFIDEEELMIVTNIKNESGLNVSYLLLPFD